MSTEMQRATRAIVAGSRVVASPYCSTPSTLLRELGDLSAVVPGLALSAGLLLGEMPFLDAVKTGSLRLMSWHMSGALRGLATRGIVDYLPLRASEVARHLSGRVDVALIRVSPPDAGGWCSLGPSASYTKALVATAGVVIAEVDTTMPRPVGEDARIRRSDIDFLVDSDTALATYPEAAASEVTDRIARTVVDFIPNGANVQLGIGAVPQSVASQLAVADVSDLRMIGLACDSMIGLMESGRLMPGESIRAAEILGTDMIFSVADGNPAIRLASSATIHNPLWLATQPRLISVCSALAVDLSGQVASESIEGKILAGVGGSADFFDGAGLSAGGLRIIAIPSTTNAGGSRITAEFGTGTAVTLPRHSVDVVVTEFGAATLSGLPIAERAVALAAVAAPQHRDALLAGTSSSLTSHAEGRGARAEGRRPLSKVKT
ncbi:acetyl-CoA hydrolase/transferase family protein [Cryobacterium flavum]|nr:acetyl-CoA hydrolase/transferase C-terminal domain-containing protein [Cryobacterium flavum]